MELTTDTRLEGDLTELFMMSKIQNLNGTHNTSSVIYNAPLVVYDVKDTKFEWNSQRVQVGPQKYKGCL